MLTHVFTRVAQKTPRVFSRNFSEKIATEATETVKPVASAAAGQPNAFMRFMYVMERFAYECYGCC